MFIQQRISVQTKGRGIYDLSQRIHDAVAQAGVVTGICHLFIQHTSASLIICENADPDVMHDLENFMQRLVPDGDPLFVHTAEGPDDMPAHVRSILTQSELSVPISEGRCALGTWQGVYLYEHRSAPHLRNVIVTLHGEPSKAG